MDNIKIPKLMPMPNNTFRLVENYSHNNITIPKGYETNGASIPRLLWWIIPPFKPSNMTAIVIHDFLTDIAVLEKGSVRADLMKTADRIFYETMDNKFDKITMYIAIRLYHKLRYGLINQAYNKVKKMYVK